ncbi:adenine nucleotide alpha hydrolases-like protein [Tilletiaria anomala UBC 951]|uniref:FAD synthase n=1 Tax=Tilletiaria anomala (strain ATCC 24038 / CBS 436.72 / UBC 951) TaxID=1037660 RepID=A0A066VUL9_TILAU|nr:adenine nucleotide alpha hydrolases-like protein [Tilletiaria anomala UBC 951]KDN43968.1 adenine nucleotide alpha hydrolases-like protein [Tilletiaria anomala UBC 951]
MAFPTDCNEDSSSSAEWLATLDAVYTLLEDPVTRAAYPHLAQRVQDAVSLTEEIVRELGPEQISLSFNGGKDCTVLVHILSAVLRRLSQKRSLSTPSSSRTPPIPPLRSVYITCPSPFAEVERFIRSSSRRYNLRVRSVAGDMRQGLEEYLSGGGECFCSCVSASYDGHSVTAIFIGTRSTDPNGRGIGRRAWTDSDWPRVERVHPILDWSYNDVWEFLRCPLFKYKQVDWEEERLEQEGCARSPGLPYCLLYDLGYTSLGSTYNTFPNPELQRKASAPANSVTGATQKGDEHVDAIASGQPSRGDEGRTASYRPAYELADGDLERKGRVKVGMQPC